MQTNVNLIKYEPIRDKQEKNLIRLIILSLRGKHVDAFECTLIARKEFGLIIDWHEFSNILDYMERIGEIKFISINHNGARIYQP